ncbi:MAG: hypothetical protein ACPGWR_17755 [Ardenticatenaceae bacterium]
MYEKTKTDLRDAQEQAKSARKTIRETHRSALRSYLQAGFKLQRAGLDALDALNRGAEEWAFGALDRAEEAQDKAAQDAEERWGKRSERWQQRSERWRDRADRAQARVQEEKAEAKEARDTRLRQGSAIGLTIMKVIGRRVDNMLGEMANLSRRELRHMEERIDGKLNDLNNAHTEPQTDQLPIPNYDAMNVDQTLDALDDLNTIELRTVRRYEAHHKNRLAILRAIDEKLAQMDEVEEAEVV